MDFFSELERLQLKIPRWGLLQLQNTNSDYTYCTDQLKNCYMIMNAVCNQDCMYGRDFYNNDDCVDCDHVFGCQLCYECLNCKNCYNCVALQDCENSRDCDFGYDLKSCSDCIGCVGLRRKQYCIFNEQFSKDEYFERKKSLIREEVLQHFEELKLKIPRIFAYQVVSENCTGDYVHHCQNVFEGYDVNECQDCGYIIESKNCTDSYDITILEDSTLCYEISSSHILNNSSFCFLCSGCSDIEYCELVLNSQYCFGCIGLNHKRYYILNQPYGRDEYFKKVAEIKDELRAKGEYGKRFLPSTYPLEDTVAMWAKM